MPWALTKKAYVLLSVCLAMVVAGFVSVQHASADAITGTDGNGLAAQTERWVRLRAITKCVGGVDVSKNSYNRILDGKFLSENAHSDTTTTIGYLNDDGKVSCGDGAFVSNTFKTIGFADNLAAFCSVQPMASRGSSDTKTTDNFEGCTTGSGDEFDMQKDGADQEDEQVKEFKAGYQKYASTPASWSPKPEMMYYLYKESLVKFCGAELIGKYDPADEANINADKRKVVVNDVDLATGEIIRNVYSLSRDQTDGVDWLYINDELAPVKRSCGEMAQKTWEYDEDMAKSVKAYNTANPDDIGSGYSGNEGDGSAGSNEVVCSAGALGWVLCPVMKIMAETTEWVAGQLEDYLAFNPFAGSGNQIRTLWTNILNVANVMLVIAFLVVVFSQSTSIGLSSYGIKRMLPRIIAAAILMNLSYYICQILIDLSNIAGVGVTSLVSAASGNTFSENVADVGVVRTALAATAIVAVILFFFLIPVVLAFLAIFFTIAARNAIIVLLVIVAPLAFAAWILPNTEKYFKKWWELFFNMLILFPMTMLLFSASVVAANVIQTSGTPSDAEGSDQLQSIIALIVLALPLFAMPLLFKTASGALSRINDMTKRGMNRYGGEQAKGFFDNTRKRKMQNTGARMAANRLGLDENGRRKRSFGGAIGGGLSTVGGYKARRDFRLNSQKSDAERLQQDSIANRLQADGSRLAAKSTLRGDTGRAIARARGIQMQDQMIGEEMKAANTVIENMGLSNAEIGKLGSTGTGLGMDGKKLSGDLYQKAAQAQLVSTGQVGHIYDMLDKAGKVDPTTGKAYMSDEVRGNLAYHLERNFSMLKAKDHTLNSDTIKESLRTGGGEVTQSQLQEAALANLSGLKKEQFAEQDAKGIGYLAAGIQAAKQQISTMPTATVEQREARANLEKQVQTAIETAATSYNDALLEGKFTVKSREAAYQLLSSQGIRVAPPQSSSAPQSSGSPDGEIIIPRANTTPPSQPPTDVQQTREQGGNFNGGPGQTPPSSNP